MTDLEPAPAPLVSRQAAKPVVAPPPTMAAFKPENLQVAEQLAKAGDVLPQAYSGKPGACLLLMDWAERNEVSLLEAAAEVSFNRGRSSVGARMQRKLASRVGYITRLVEGDDISCTVAVFHQGNEVGQSTYTYAQAEALGIIYLNGKSGTLKSTWAGDPAQMLYHRATTRALDHWGPAELSGAFVEPYDGPDDNDAVAVIEAVAAPVEPVAIDAPEPVSEAAQVVPGFITADDLKADIKAANGKTQAGAIQFIQGKLGDGFTGLELIAADGQAVDLLLGWLDS